MPRRILLVDDDDAALTLGRVALSAGGAFEVETASSGAACLARASAAPPDAILLDLLMPDLDGAATLVALRARPETRTIPVIFCTAKDRPDDVAALVALGAAGVVCKPYDPLRLGGAVAALLDAAPRRDPR